MTVLDWILITLIGSYCLYVLFRKNKKGCCSGNCAQCSGCCHSAK